MEIRWHGTAAAEIICGGGRILFDPFVPLKGAQQSGDIGQYDGFEHIFVTHGHFDHIADLPEIYRRNPDVRIYCTQTPYRTLRRKGIPAENLRLISYGDKVCVNGFEIAVFHGRHAVLPKPSRKRIAYILRSAYKRNLWFMFRENSVCRENDETLLYQIEAEGKRVLMMGSLNLREDEKYPEGCDLLLLPYNGWEDNFPPAQRVIERLKPQKVLLHHYDDSFPPLTMPLDLSPILGRYEGSVSAMKRDKSEFI